MAINKKGVRGDEHRVYRDTAGNYTTPTWSEMTSLKMTGFDLQRAVKEIISRLSKYKANRLGKIEIKIPFSASYHKADPDREAILAAAVADPATDLTVGLADGAIATSGTVYHKLSVLVSNYKEDWKDDDIVEVSGEFVLGDVFTNAPSMSNTVA